MKFRRWLMLVPALALLLGCATWLLLRTPVEPQHDGKPLSFWFKSYTGVRPQQMAPLPPGPPFVVVSNRIVWRRPEPLPRDAAWPALEAIGSNAAPYLAAQMEWTAWDRFYERNYTNLPVILQKRLAPPGERWMRRLRAIEIAQRLGPAAHATAPAMFRLLRRPDVRLTASLPKALRSVRADRVAVAAVIEQFGAERNYSEVVRLVGEFGAAEPGVARLLGKILADPRAVHHREAIRLLESNGAHAGPAAREIIGALGYADAEVRYLAARALEHIAATVPAADQPEFERLLRRAMADPSVMVSNAARRVLARLPDRAAASPTGN